MNLEQMLEVAVRKANENNERMDGTAECVFQIMDGADIVLAVWNDEEATFGVGFRVVKGLSTYNGLPPHTSRST